MTNEAAMSVKNENDPKLEVVHAYQEVLNKLTKRISEPEMIHQKNLQEEKEQLVQAASQETPKTINSFFSQFKSHFLQTAQQLEDEFLAAQKKLAGLTETCNIRAKEIADLYEIKINADTLKALIMAQEEQRLLFETQMKEQRQFFEQEMQQRKRDWQLEEQKYNHQRDLAREKERNLYEGSKRNLDRELAAARLEFNKSCEEREAKIIEREQEFHLLKEKVETFPEQLQKAVQKAEEMVTKQLTMQFNYEAQLLQKEIKLYEQTVATLEAKIAHFESFKNSLNQLSFATRSFNSQQKDGLIDS